MAFIQVIGMFDDPGALERAKSALVRAGLATEGTMRIEPERLVAELHPLPQSEGLWERLERWLKGAPDGGADIYAEGVRRGSTLLVVTVPDEQAEEVRQLMRRHGAVDPWRRARRWKGAGWSGYDPSAPEEVDDEEAACIDEQAETTAENDIDERELTVRLFDEATGLEIGRISEAELAVLQDALEEEDPDDNDYWINPDTIDMLACRPGATPHLIRLLRRAVGDNPDGIDIAFQREGERRQSLRSGRAGAAGRD
jgi:hypothetical protein